MELEYLKRKEIDIAKWDALVDQNPEISHSNYSWFLDTICKNWGALKVKEKEIYFPTPFLKGLRNKILYQPIFSRQLDIIRAKNVDINLYEEVIQNSIIEQFKYFNFHSDFKFDLKSGKRVWQKIESIDTYEKVKEGYSSNAKRMLKKFDSSNLKMELNNGIETSIELLIKTIGQKVKELKKEEFQILKKLIAQSIDKEIGQLINLKKQGKTIATGFFIIKNKRLVFIKGAAEPEEMKKGAMYFLMDQIFQKFESEITEIDFDGSNIESVATFYKKLGGKDFEYFHNKNIDKFPIKYKLMNKTL